MTLDVESVVIHSKAGKYHRATRDYDRGSLTASPKCRVHLDAMSVSEYPELPEEVLVEELCDRCFPRGE